MSKSEQNTLTYSVAAIYCIIISLINLKQTSLAMNLIYVSDEHSIKCKEKLLA